MADQLTKLSDYLDKNWRLAGLIIFAVFLSLFGYLQAFDGFADPDSYYHIKMAVLIATNGIITNFLWLPLSILQNNYIDHHFLYHAYLAPFVSFLSPLIGAKLGHVILAAGFVLFFFYLLTKLKIKRAFWFTLSFLLAPLLLARLSLIKAQPLALILFFAGFYLIWQKKYWWLVPLGFIYVWSYDGWFLLLLLSLIYVLSDVVYELISQRQGLIEFLRLKRILIAVKAIGQTTFITIKKRDNLKLLATTTGGLLLGIVLNPYWPKNLYFYYVHIWQIALVNYQDKFSVGNEWYRVNLSSFIPVNFFIVFVPLALVTVIFLQYWRILSQRIHFLIWTVIIIFAATIKSNRMIEYLAPLMILASALLLQGVNKLASVQEDWQKIKNKLRSWLNVPRAIKSFLIFCLITAAIAVFSPSSNYNPGVIKTTLTNAFPAYRQDSLRLAAEEIKRRSANHDLVLNFNFGDFPVLFYYDDVNSYALGLDNTFSYLYNPGLFDKLSSSLRPENLGNLYDLAHDEYRAKFILLETRDQSGKIISLDDKRLKPIFVAPDLAVYQIN